jgi:hypothetical protein
MKMQIAISSCWTVSMPLHFTSFSCVLFFFLAKSSLHTDDHFQWWFLDVVGTQLVRIDRFEISWPSFSIVDSILLGIFGLSFALQPWWCYSQTYLVSFKVSVFVGYLWLELCLAALMMLFAGVSSKLQVSVFVGFLWLELCLAAYDAIRRRIL